MERERERARREREREIKRDGGERGARERERYVFEPRIQHTLNTDKTIDRYNRQIDRQSHRVCIM